MKRSAYLVKGDESSFITIVDVIKGRLEDNPRFAQGQTYFSPFGNEMKAVIETTKRRQHFSFINGNKEGANESLTHAIAKQTLAEIPFFSIKRRSGITKIHLRNSILEKKLNCGSKNYYLDVHFEVLSIDSPANEHFDFDTIGFEIFVTHQLPEDKINDIRINNIPCLEIDLTKTGIHKEELKAKTHSQVIEFEKRTKARLKALFLKGCKVKMIHYPNYLMHYETTTLSQDDVLIESIKKAISNQEENSKEKYKESSFKDIPEKYNYKSIMRLFWKIWYYLFEYPHPVVNFLDETGVSYYLRISTLSMFYFFVSSMIYLTLVFIIY